MPYFDIENLRKITELGKDNFFQILRVLIILVLAGVVAAVIFFKEGRGPGGEGPEGETGIDGRKVTEEEKLKILESLSAPDDAPILTNEEKKKILENLSAPQGSGISDEEKRVILESLGAPKK